MNKMKAKIAQLRKRLNGLDKFRREAEYSDEFVDAMGFEPEVIEELEALLDAIERDSPDRLHKPLCQRCAGDEYEADWDTWNAREEYYWELGKVYCDLEDLENGEGDWAWINEEPPEWCPYALEQKVVMQDE